MFPLRNRPFTLTGRGSDDELRNPDHLMEIIGIWVEIQLSFSLSDNDCYHDMYRMNCMTMSNPEYMHRRRNVAFSCRSTRQTEL